MPKPNYDQRIEQLMNDEGLSHKEAMQRVESEGKKSKPEADDGADDSVDGDVQNVELPENLLPEVSKGKEVDVSICGTVVGSGNGMVQIKTRRFSVNVSEPMKPLKDGPSVTNAY